MREFLLDILKLKHGFHQSNIWYVNSSFSSTTLEGYESIALWKYPTHMSVYIVTPGNLLSVNITASIALMPYHLAPSRTWVIETFL